MWVKSLRVRRSLVNKNKQHATFQQAAAGQKLGFPGISSGKDSAPPKNNDPSPFVRRGLLIRK